MSPLCVALLTELATTLGAAILIVANSTSSRIGRTGYRCDTIGHEEFANGARSVLTIVQELEFAERRQVLPVKSNLCENRAGMSFSIRKGVVEWSSTPIPMTGEEYFTRASEKLKNPLVREECSEVDRVTNWQRERLSRGEVASVLVRMDAVENEIAYSTLRRAFCRLGCKTSKAGGGGPWHWRLPGQVAVSVEDSSGELG